MSTEPEDNNAIVIVGTTLTSRDQERILASIRADARKIREAVERMGEDANRLVAGGSDLSAHRLEESITTVRVALEHLRDVFRVSF